jgi:hypothetical protein
MEVVQTVRGRTEDPSQQQGLGGESRLCKAALFHHFRHTVSSLATWHHGANVQHAANIDCYADAKVAAVDYGAAKIAAYRTLMSARLGSWVRRPPEEDDFYA